MKNIIKALLVSTTVCAVVAGFTVSASAQKTGYRLLNKIAVGGDGGWDYLIADADADRLYVSHATHVVVIDTKTDKVVGDIPNTNGVHGIAFDHKTGRGFVSNGRDNTVTIFDLKTLANLGTVKTGTNPDAIMFDPATNRVFAFNGRSNDATVIGAADGKVAGTIALGGKPEFAVSDEKGTVYVNIEDKSEIVAIDAKTLTVKSRWSLAPGEGPSGLAIDRKNNRLFSVCDKKMVIVDAGTGKVIGNVATGDGTDAAGFDPGTKYAFSSNGEGTLTIIHEDSADKYSIAENVTTQRSARTMALDTKTHKVYLATAQYGPVPAATAAQPRPRAPMVPGSFVILVFGK